MEIESPIRDKPPCKDCSERCVTESFNCHNSCPKDERGEFGYRAWREKVDSAKQGKAGIQFQGGYFF